MGRIRGNGKKRTVNKNRNLHAEITEAQRKAGKEKESRSGFPTPRA